MTKFSLKVDRSCSIGVYISNKYCYDSVRGREGSGGTDMFTPQRNVSVTMDLMSQNNAAKALLTYYNIQAMASAKKNRKSTFLSHIASYSNCREALA